MARNITLVPYTWAWAVDAAADHATRYNREVYILPSFGWDEEGIPEIIGYTYSYDLPEILKAGVLAKVTEDGVLVRAGA